MMLARALLLLFLATAAHGMGNYQLPPTRLVLIPVESYCRDASGNLLWPPEQEPELVAFGRRVVRDPQTGGTVLYSGVQHVYGRVTPGTCVRVVYGEGWFLRLRCSSVAEGWSILSARAAELSPGAGYSCVVSEDFS